MSKFKFVNIVDIIFVSIVTFLIVFAWVQFFVKSFMLSLFLSAVLDIGILMFVRWIKSKKYNIKQESAIKKQNFSAFKLAIQTMSDSKLSALIKKHIPSRYMPKINKGDITFVKDDKLFAFTFALNKELTEDRLLQLLKVKNYTNLTIFCADYHQDTKLIAGSFISRQINLITLEQLFEIFNKYNINIDTSHIDLNKHKVSIKEILKNSISQSKSKGYFISGLVLLLTSLIIPFKIYYVVFSSVLFALSLACRFKSSPKTNYDIFD